MKVVTPVADANRARRNMVPCVPPWNVTGRVPRERARRS
jgi:hypothetical protein